MTKLNLLNQEQMIAFAQNTKISNDEWMAIIQKYHSTRALLIQKFESFQQNRFWIEIAVKTAVSIVLGISLLINISPALMFGASLTLALSSIVYACINPKEFNVDIPNDNQHETELSEQRKEWIDKAKLDNYEAKHQALIKNMIRAGLALVTGFATYAAITSGAELLMTISSVLFSSTLFLRQIDTPAPSIPSIS